MRKRRIDPTLIAFAAIFLFAAAAVTAFLIATSIVSQDDARIYPTTATPYPYFSPYYPQPQPTSPAAVLGPTLEPRPAAVSQTINGITIIVQPRYADLQRIVLTYTISGPTQSYPYEVGLDSYLNNWPYLTLDNAITLPFNTRTMYESGYSNWLSLPSGDPTPNEGILSFDTSIVSDLSSPLAMHLTLPIMVNNVPVTYPSPVPTLAPGARATDTPDVPAATPPPSVENFTFDFDLSTQVDNRCRLATPAVSAERSGVKMTLDTVSITASEARIGLSFSGTFNGQQVSNSTAINPGSGWNSSGTMDTGPGTAQLYLTDNCLFGPCSLFTGFHYRAQSLIDAPQNQWLLKVDNLYDQQGLGSITGPWIFKFEVPPASPCTSVPTPSGTAIPTALPTPTP